ncbi:poly(U)-specific endoribonuclease-like [Lytechinus variegatus]|uniref:poly(U)-specific endoribonuclease-like n=1 Tax=Lytechinus variegatus TaxID=7654 RepID=UPI001BB26E82|nr:poly(U)-specific endoribonuclease-like [Lytechinus variegatus]
MKVAPILLLCLTVHTQGILGSTDSCVGRCNTSPDSSKDCQCNTVCGNYGDCCTDYYAECLGGEYSCQSRCGESYNRNNPCHCNDLCKQYDNCCADYDDLCSAGDPNSCQSRCGETYDQSNPCHCNDACKQHGNCCDDYDNLCSGIGDISSLTEALWEADVNRLSGSDLVVNKQNPVTSVPERNDVSSQPLFTHVSQARISTGTWPTFRALLDNYQLLTGTLDVNTVLESQEVQSFLDAVFGTQVMDLTYDYLQGRGYVSSVSDLRAKVEKMWFEPYSRSGGTLDTSGFEHVFVGEVKNSKVSGYHNWFAFYEDEVEGKVNYYGFTSENEPNQILMQFRLDAPNGSSYYKELSSILYGASPEFELAIFTVCFMENRNGLTTFTINGGQEQQVQTWDYNGQDYVGSAYFNV